MAVIRRKRDYATAKYNSMSEGIIDAKIRHNRTIKDFIVSTYHKNAVAQYTVIFGVVIMVCIGIFK